MIRSLLNAYWVLFNWLALTFVNNIFTTTQHWCSVVPTAVSLCNQSTPEAVLGYFKSFHMGCTYRISLTKSPGCRGFPATRPRRRRPDRRGSFSVSGGPEPWRRSWVGVLARVWHSPVPECGPIKQPCSDQNLKTISLVLKPYFQLGTKRKHLRIQVQSSTSASCSKPAKGIFV